MTALPIPVSPRTRCKGGTGGRVRPDPQHLVEDPSLLGILAVCSALAFARKKSSRLDVALQEVPRAPAGPFLLTLAALSHAGRPADDYPVGRRRRAT